MQYQLRLAGAPYSNFHQAAAASLPESVYQILD
jgi:hypothetical protein